MHKIKKISLFATIGLIAIGALISLNVGVANAATIGSKTAYWQQFYQNIYSRILNRINAPRTLAVRTPTTAPQPASADPMPEPDPISNSKIWGAYTGNTASSFTSFEQQIGKKPDIHAVFMGWGDSFPTSLADPLKANNQTLLIFWEPYGTSLDAIISGQSDSYIKQFAQQARAYGGPVILVPFHEMNGDWNPWGGTVGSNTPAKAISAWRRVHDLFSGVTNVKWGWAVNNVSVPNTAANQIKNYYPGDNYVDYVGVDGFNFGNPWQTYSQVFSSSLNQLRTYNKPIYIFSTACAAGPEKAAWITDALSKIQSDPDIKGWVWFNANKERNWLVNSDPASLQAFKEGIR